MANFGILQKSDFFDGVYEFIVLGVLGPREAYRIDDQKKLVRRALTRASEMV